MAKPGPVPKDPELLRKLVGVRLAPATRKRLVDLHETTGDSQGVIIDKAVAQYRPKKPRPSGM